MKNERDAAGHARVHLGFLDLEGVTLDTKPYRDLHGQEPSGLGTWQFIWNGKLEVMPEMEFEVAAQRIKVMAARKGFRGEIIVRA